MRTTKIDESRVGMQSQATRVRPAPTNLPDALLALCEDYADLSTATGEMTARLETLREKTYHQLLMFWLDDLFSTSKVPSNPKIHIHKKDVLDISMNFQVQRNFSIRPPDGCADLSAWIVEEISNLTGLSKSVARKLADRHLNFVSEIKIRSIDELLKSDESIDKAAAYKLIDFVNGKAVRALSEREARAIAYRVPIITVKPDPDLLDSLTGWFPDATGAAGLLRVVRPKIFVSHVKWGLSSKPGQRFARLMNIFKRFMQVEVSQ